MVAQGPLSTVDEDHGCHGSEEQAHDEGDPRTKSHGGEFGKVSRRRQWMTRVQEVDGVSREEQPWQKKHWSEAACDFYDRQRDATPHGNSHAWPWNHDKESRQSCWLKNHGRMQPAVPCASEVEMHEVEEAQPHNHGHCCLNLENGRCGSMDRFPFWHDWWQRRLWWRLVVE